MTLQPRRSQEDDPRTCQPCCTLAIYNFDHGITSNWSFSIGPYRIHVKTEHLSSDAVSTSDRTTLSTRVDEAGALQFATVTMPAYLGRWAPTAELEGHPNLHGKSLLLPEVPGRTELHDVALILSFLSGRDVVIGNDVPQSFWLNVGEPVVSANYFYTAQIDWNVLATMAGDAGTTAMHAVCLAMSNVDLLAKIALASAALDQLSSKWYGSSKYNAPTKVALGAAKDAFEGVLREKGVSTSVIEDTLPRLSGLRGESAIAKLSAFLIANKMFPGIASPEAVTRLKLLNQHRNAVLHRSTIHVLKDASFEINAQVAGAIAILIIQICRVFVAGNLLKVDDDEYGIEKERRTILEFFETGIFRGQAVFDQSFEAFFDRLKDAWVSSGELLF